MLDCINHLVDTTIRTDDSYLMNTATTPYPRRWLALIPLLFAVFMDMVDAQIVAIALPSIRAEMGVSGAALEWVAVGYTLAFAVLLLPGSRLGDRYGRRAAFLAGTAGFTVASLLAGLSSDIAWLLVARLAQGASAGVMVPQVLAFIQSEFPDNERGKAFGIYGITFPIGGLAGPLLGGVLVGADLLGLGWRAIFMVNVPIGIATFAAAALLMPRRAHRPGTSIDGVGVLLAASALVSFLVPLTQGWQSGWPVWSIALLVAAVLLAGLFLLHEGHRAARGADPLVDPSLLRTTGFAGGLIVAWLFFAGMSVFFVLTLHLQSALGYSPMTTALAFLPATIGIVVGNGLAISVSTGRGRGFVAVGVALSALGVAGIAATLWMAGASLQGWQLLPATIAFGTGLGMTAGKLVNAVLVDVPIAQAGAASGVVNTVLQVGVTTGIAIVGTVYFNRVADAGSTEAASVALVVALGMLGVALLATRLLPAPAPALPRAETERGAA